MNENKIMRKVELSNVLCEFINETHPKLVNELNPFVGTNILTRSGDFLAKVLKKLSPDSFFKSKCETVNIENPKNSFFKGFRITYFFDYNGYSTAFVKYTICGWYDVDENFHGSNTIQSDCSVWLFSLGKGYEFLEKLNSEYTPLPIYDTADVIGKINKIEDLRKKHIELLESIPEELRYEIQKI